MGHVDKPCIARNGSDNAVMAESHRTGVSVAGICLLFAGGCASTGLSPLSYGARRVEGGNELALFDAARTVLVDLGYQIDRENTVAGMITTQPTLEPRRSSNARGRISSAGQWRRVVEVRVDDRGDAVQVFCKVAIQQQVTAAHRMFAYDRSGTDVPGATPIERDAATTAEQNTVWQTIRRNKTAERDILEAILQQAEGPSG